MEENHPDIRLGICTFYSGDDARVRSKQSFITAGDDMREVLAQGHIPVEQLIKIGGNALR